MRLFQFISSIIIINSIFISCKNENGITADLKKQKIEIQKTLIEDTAMVSTARVEASIIANEIMKAGGNAIDAAIATQFALAVCYPIAGNIGGGGFMIIRMNNGQIDALDYREMAPALASRDMYIDKNGNANDDLSRNGHLSSGVPGTVNGMINAFNKYSKLRDWKSLIQPAIDLAQNGIIITNHQANLLNKYSDQIKKYNTVSNVFSQKDTWKAGDLLVQSDLANTLILIRDKQNDGFYQGITAKKIVAEMKRSNGIITLDDLNNYEAIWRTPITSNYRGHKIISMPPPSSGGIALTQLLKMIEPYDMRSLGFHTKESIHLMVEAERRVYADRSKHLGDIDFYPVPVNKLIDSNYIANRLRNFNPDRATPSNDIEASNMNESEETTHYSIVDPFGNAVSTTTTLNGHYGSKVLVGSAGFFMNNEMDDFSSKPGSPNMFGLLGAEANKIEPKKRMLSSMTPTIVEKNGNLLLTVGTPGGSTIITSVFQTIVNVIDHQMSAKDAISAQRFHHQWMPDLIYVEKPGFSDILTKSLNSLGHTIKIRKPIGKVEAILCKDNLIEGAADPRADDDVRGY